MRLDLIEEYRFFVNPVIFGSGRPTFKNIQDRRALKLLKTETLRSGVVIL
ncbi:MAG: dihydrofolate reductase family protein [Candidatus Methylomirabilaceae bacterium]